ncbi:MAG: Lrp/AsnC family transcriptional regulator [Lachnospiraceae bacterium]|nr:Lrp/AsnC family transcriptional regulator [Lachnospiraceae bacterium]
MDKVDKLLVQLLQQNARYSLKELSEQVYLSSPAVAFRINKLEEKKIITGYHAEVNPEQLGYHITAYISVAMSPKKKQVFLPFIAEFPNVLECSVVAGEKSVILKAMFPSTEALDTFIGKVQKFGPTESQIVLSEVVPSRGITVSEN